MSAEAIFFGSCCKPIKSNEQIIDVMTSRFGNFVLYKPPFDWTTVLLWGLPLILLLFSGGAMWRYLHRRAKASASDNVLSAEQRQALRNLLQQNETDAKK